MLLEAPDQARDLRAEDAGVGVHLVQHQKAGLDALKNLLVALAQQKQLEHNVVGDQDVGRLVLDLAAGVALLGRRGGRPGDASLLSVLLVQGRVASIAAEGDARAGQ